MRPAPIPVISTSLPGSRRPSSAASASASGIEPGRCVAVAIDVHHDLLLGDAELLGSVIDDPDIRLMRHVHVDVIHCLSTFGKDRLCRRHHHAGRELEHLAAVHLHEPLGILEQPRAAPGQPQATASRPVGPKLEAEEASVLGRLEHDGSCAVAEEHERRAVAPVEDLREHVATDHQRTLGEAGREHRVGLGNRVHESGAAGRQVVRRRVGHPELVGEQRGRRRKRHVGRDRRDDQQVDGRRVDTRHLEGANAGGQRDVGHRLLGLGDPALADARARDDPFVGGVDELTQIVVRHDPLGHVAAEAGDRDPAACLADHSSPTANVSVPRTAS